MNIKFQTIKLLAAFLIISVLLNDVCGQSITSENYFSSSNRLAFGSHLYKEKDYLRALGEFKEYLRSNENDTVQFRMANCYLRIGRHEEAADNFKLLFYGSSVTDESRLMFYKSLFSRNDYKSFREYTLRENYLPQSYIGEIERLKYITFFLDNSVMPKEDEMLAPFPDSVRSQISKFYLNKKFPKQKSVSAAVLLSAIIPGAGKIYTGDIGDGLTVFVATALSAYLAYSNFKNDHQFRGWLFTGLTAFFYGGNIYGSAASAQIYNARIRFNFDNEVKLFFEQRNYFLPKMDL
ncbi:MAG: hypothetical protein CVV24_13835 [Ignavibacteriae bacterium HGW-Ignavibacteriae-3]|nr:MAG: hypothetical protein CVV24_13835 [Ignavibacteriae bacterium HGW-Ignavibacteriae-3]